MSAKSYDQSYFNKWYRDPAHRVITPATARRKAHLALAVAEYYLEHPVALCWTLVAGRAIGNPF